MTKRAFVFFSFFVNMLNATSIIPDQLNLYQSIDSMVIANDGNVGKQIILDLYECQSEHLDNLTWVRDHMIEAAKRAQGHVVESSFHKFQPFGISGVVVIEESHIAIHIWPEFKYAAIDIFTCSDALGVKEAAKYLTETFQSNKPIELVFTRGKGMSNTIVSTQDVP